MSCVREASLEPPAPYHAAHQPTHEHRNGEGRKGRFLRGLRRMFRRRGTDHSPDSKSRSTSELLQDCRSRRKEGAYSSGLSVSHDSVLTGDHSGDESGDDRSLHVPRLTSGQRSELIAAVRRRGRGDASDDDEDLGLPHSPPASPPTDKADKRHHAAISASSCSDGSLLSVGSSEMDEDSSSGHQHDLSNRSDLSEYTGEPPSGVAPLSHSAARHKMAVRPRRTHGAPRRNKNLPIAAPVLPITPELNEEMIRSTTPDADNRQAEDVTESFSSTKTTTKLKEVHSQLSKEINRVMEVTPSDTKLKSSSLPPGLALSQLVGQSPAKLSLPEHKETPRSSIKRSKSSNQGKSLMDDTPQNNYNENKEQKNAKESKKTERKTEETTRTSRKDESFFSRLLLRRSKKDPKVKKESELDQKKQKLSDKVAPQYKSVDREYASACSEYGKIQQRTHSADRNISAGQKVFLNQAHKRMDNKGVYVQDIAKSNMDYGANDLKIADETDKMLNMELKYSYRPDKKRHKDEYKNDSFNLHTPERSKRPTNLHESFSQNQFSQTDFRNTPRDSAHLSPKIITDELTERPIPIPRKTSKDFCFHSGSMPKAIPYFNQNLKLSASASPPKTIFPPPENIKKLHRSSELSYSNSSSELLEPPFDAYPITQQEKEYASELRSLGEEYIEPRNAIGKSHSFRHQSEMNSLSSQDQMPSLPAIVGISDPLLESWEVNYRRSVRSERFIEQNGDKRLSARNYDVFNSNVDQFDSLASTDSSYLDSLKGENQNEERKPLFINSVVINDAQKRDRDISQIEANIDNIIRSPKPLIAAVLKSSSLDSVKSVVDKQSNVEDRRKTIAIENTVSTNGSIDRNENIEVPKGEPETYVSITHLNKEMNTIQTKPALPIKLSKSDEKIHANPVTGVPEFLKIQLNKVDSKPATNVVLTANVTPKKIEPVIIAENNVSKDPEDEKDVNETPLQMYLRKTGSQQLLNRSLEFLAEESSKNPEKLRNSPLNVRKSAPPPVSLQCPTTPKVFLRKKTTSVDETKVDDSRTSSVSTDSNEKICENSLMDQKSFSSFGSKTSLQSSDSNEAKTPDKSDDGVVYRRKPIIVPKEQRNGSKKDEEPELMKVFARRSLKLKDSEVETLAQEIAEANITKESVDFKTKSLKNEFNSSIKSRDSDKENEDQLSDNTDIKIIDLDSNKQINDVVPNIKSRLSHFGGTHYPRSISINSVVNVQTNTKSALSAPAQMRNEVSKYRKEIADSTPEKRLRNRTFPDSSNDREDIKGINAKNEGLNYKIDTISKKPWLKKTDETTASSNIETDNKIESKENDEEKQDNVTDGAPQFRGILQMKAEWERRAKQGMTK